VRGNYRPISPRGQLGDSHDIVWMHGGYVHYTRYQTGLRTPILTRDIADPAVEPGRRGGWTSSRTTGRPATCCTSTTRGWSGWQSLGLGPDGHPIGPPTVASWSPRRLDVFAVDQVTGRLLQRTYQSGWED
jgi:hypothetical protein